jgi:hypothetical protein
MDNPVGIMEKSRADIARVRHFFALRRKTHGAAAGAGVLGKNIFFPDKINFDYFFKDIGFTQHNISWA